MNNIDITKIAVKFDPENTTEELFNSVVEKFVGLGYVGVMKWINSKRLNSFPYVVIDEDGDLCKVSDVWCRISDYRPLSPQEFLALGDASQKQPAVDNNTIIAEWLDKVQYVFDNDRTIECLDFVTMTLETDHGDVRGAGAIVKFIDSRHNQLTSERKAKEKAELEAKRQKLMDELSEIDQQLGLYN